MKQPKQQTTISAETNFNEADKTDLHLLTAKLSALCEASENTLNKIELTAVLGMISYVAHTQKVEETIVAEILIAHFGVSAVAKLPSRFYQMAIEYLVDLKMDKILN